MSTGCQKVSQTDRKIDSAPAGQADRVTERQNGSMTIRVVRNQGILIWGKLVFAPGTIAGRHFVFIELKNTGTTRYYKLGQSPALV